MRDVHELFAIPQMIGGQALVTYRSLAMDSKWENV